MLSVLTRCWTFFALALLAGCTGPNTTMATLQFSGATVTFPQNYQREAARVVSQRGFDPASATVSYPRPTLGATAFQPQRWYVCIRGASIAQRPDRLPKAFEILDQAIDPRSTAGIHNVVLIFGSDGRRPSERGGFDSPLCRDGQYEPITAKVPLT